MHTGQHCQHTCQRDDDTPHVLGPLVAEAFCPTGLCERTDALVEASDEGECSVLIGGFHILSMGLAIHWEARKLSTFSSQYFALKKMHRTPIDGPSFRRPGWLAPESFPPADGRW